MVARRIDHSAGTGDPPQTRRLQAAREIAGRKLNVGIGSDDDLLAIGDIARQQHRQRLSEGRICSHLSATYWLNHWQSSEGGMPCQRTAATGDETGFVSGNSDVSRRRPAAG